MFFQKYVWKTHATIMEIRDQIVEASDVAGEWVEFLKTVYGTVERYISPWRVPILLMSIYLLFTFMQDAASSETPLSTPCGS